MTNQEYAKNWFAAIDANDAAAMGSMLAPDHQFHNPMGPALDAQGHIGMMQMWAASFSNFKHSFDHFVSEGDWVAIRGNVRLKHTGEFNGVPATGKEVVLPWIDLMRISNGKIAEDHMEFNPMSVMQQIS